MQAIITLEHSILEIDASQITRIYSPPKHYIYIEFLSIPKLTGKGYVDYIEEGDKFTLQLPYAPKITFKLNSKN